MDIKQQVEELFFNEPYLERKAKKIIYTDTTNDWGFDGIKSKKYIFPNGSSYEDYYESRFDANISEWKYIYRIGKKVVTKQEFLDLNKISRKVSCKGWFHKVYDDSPHIINFRNEYLKK